MIQFLSFLFKSCRLDRYGLYVGLVIFSSVSATPSWAESMFGERRKLENRWISEGLFVLPHKPNYFLAASYNDNPNQAEYRRAQEPPLEHNEVKFQLSIKVNLGRHMIYGKGDLYFGYTQLSMWQLYNRDYSSPFRDTNYEPELFIHFDSDRRLGPLTNKMIGFGVVHQSNGQSGSLSRSWNRVYWVNVLERNNWAITLKPWIRIPESSDEDTNSDIEKYLGYGELRWALKSGPLVYSCMFRNNLRAKKNKGAIEAALSFPLSRSVKGYLQVFNGYGESLIDYNHPNNRISIGIALSDWL